MSWAVPQTKVEQLADRLHPLRVGDQAELQKVHLDLHQLNERKPGNPTTLLLLARVLALLGRRDEALSKLGGACSFKRQFNTSELNFLATTYAWLGDYECSREIYDGFVFEDECKVSGNLLDNAARTAVLLGDMDYLTHVRDESKDAIEKGAETYCANEFLSAIEASEASEFFPIYQRATADVVRGHQVWVNPTVFHDGGLMLLTIEYVVAVHDRRALGRTVFDAAEKAATKAGFKPSCLLPHIDTELRPVPSAGLQAVV